MKNKYYLIGRNLYENYMYVRWLINTKKEGFDVLCRENVEDAVIYRRSGDFKCAFDYSRMIVDRAFFYPVDVPFDELAFCALESGAIESDDLLDFKRIRKKIKAIRKNSRKKIDYLVAVMQSINDKKAKVVKKEGQFSADFVKKD